MIDSVSKRGQVVPLEVLMKLPHESDKIFLRTAAQLHKTAEVNIFTHAHRYIVC